MAGSVNKVILVGHLGRDPEIRTFQNGGRVANLSLATSEAWRDKASGERRERTEWHRIVILNEQMIKVAEQYLRKGSKVYLEGQLETRKATDQAGIERYFTEVVLRQFRSDITLLDKVDNGSRGSPEEYDRADPPRQGTDNRANTDRSFGNGAPPAGGTADLDDEIPF